MPALIAVAVSEIGASLYAYQVGATLIAYSNVIAYTIVAAGTYAAAKSMQKMPNLSGLQSEVGGRMTMSRDTVASRRVIYGTVRVSGPILFASTTSNVGSTKNENLHLVLGLAGHQCGGLKGVYFNDVQAVDEAGAITSTFNNNLAYSFKFGTPSQTAFVMDDPAWTSDHKLSGICALYTKLIANANVYPNGIPNITAVVQGYDVLDMDDVTVIPGCTNPALILRHYLLNYFQADPSEIDVDSFTTARDVCDTIPSGFTNKRYECNYTFTLNTKPAKVMEDILKTCYGRLSYVNGKFVLKAGAYVTPLMSINEDDIIGQISVTTKASQANAINSVRGTFVDGLSYSSSYQPADFVPVTSSYYVNEDNGVQNPFEIELAGVTDHTQARRLAKLTLLDSRQDLTVSLNCKIGALRLIAGDNVYVTVSRYGWNSKVFTVNEMTINSDLTIGLVLKEIDSAIYDYPIGEDVDRDLSPNTNLPNPFIVPIPDGFSLSETTTRDKDGTIFPSLTMNWNASLSGSIDEVEIDYRDTASLAPTSLGTFSRNITEASTLDVIAGHTYEARIRNINYLGVYSDYVSSSIKINGNTVAPYPPSNPTILGATASIYLTWENDPRDTDYRYTRIYLGTTSNLSTAVNQGTISGTSWNKAISGEGYYWAWLQNINSSQLSSSIVSAGSSVYVHAYDFSGSFSGSQGPSGSKGDTNYNIYKRSTLVPSTPTGNLTPTGWSQTIPSDDGNALWVSTGLISGTDGITLIGSWSTPQRLSGKASYYQTSAPNNGVDATLFIGDLWFDTDDAFKVYRWDGSSWQSVQDGNIPTLSSSLQINIQNTIDYSASLAYAISNANNAIYSNSASLASQIVENSSSFGTSLNTLSTTVSNNSSSAAASINSLGATVTSNSSSFAASLFNLNTTVVNNSSSLASSISSVNGSVTTNSQSFAISLNNLSSTVTGNSQSFASSLNTTNTTVANNSSSLAASVVTLSSSFNTSLGNNSSSFASSLSSLNSTLVSNSQSFAISISNLTSTVTNNSQSLAASIVTTNTTVTNNSASLAASITSLSSSFATTSGSLVARITTTNTTVTNNSASLAASITSVSSSLRTTSASLAASIVTTNTTVTNNSSSAATSITNLTSTVTNNSASAAASVTTTANALATLSGSIAGEYVLAVRAGNRVAGFKVLSSPTSSSFDVQADRFRIFNGVNGTVTQSFLADANGVYIDQATIRNLDAGKITAGTITAAIRMTAGEITGSGYCVSGRTGIRSDDNSSIITITGGTDNGDTNGAQIDLLGNSATPAGVLNLVAGNVGAGGTTSGFIQFYTGGNQRGFVYNSGLFSFVRGLSFGDAGDDYTNMALSPNFGSNNALTYAGGSGATGVMATNEVHRWVNKGNSLELMALTNTGSLWLRSDANATAFNLPSSINLKSNIVEVNNGLYTVNKLRPVHFTWKFRNNAPDTGLIAEEVKNVLPHIVAYNGNEISGLDYSKIIPYLIAAIKELNIEVNDLKKQLKAKK